MDLGPKTKKSVIGLGKVLHAAETFNPDPEQRKSVKGRPVPVPVPAKLDSAEKPITASRRDRFANLMVYIVGQNQA